MPPYRGSGASVGIGPPRAGAPLRLHLAHFGRELVLGLLPLGKGERLQRTGVGRACQEQGRERSDEELAEHENSPGGCASCPPARWGRDASTGKGTAYRDGG